MRTLRINVTQNRINEGWRCSASSCPIAKAMRRQLRGTVLVNGDTVTFGGKFKSVELPRKAKTFVTDYDLYRMVRPFSFRITVPNKLVRTGV